MFDPITRKLNIPQNVLLHAFNTILVPEYVLDATKASHSEKTPNGMMLMQCKGCRKHIGYTTEFEGEKKHFNVFPSRLVEFGEDKEFTKVFKGCLLNHGIDNRTKDLFFISYEEDSEGTIMCEGIKVKVLSSVSVLRG